MLYQLSYAHQSLMYLEITPAPPLLQLSNELPHAEIAGILVHAFLAQRTLTGSETKRALRPFHVI
jgi:hypothetical protein